MKRWHWRTLSLVLGIGALAATAPLELQAQVVVTLEDSLVDDQNSDTIADEGDTLRYTVTITNTGTEEVGLGELILTLDPELAPLTDTLDSDPLASHAEVAVDEDNAISFELRVAELDGDTVNLTIDTAPAHGEASIVRRTPGGGFQLRYVPVENFNGADRFEALVADPDGNESAATVDIDVRPVNDAPESSDASAETAEDAAVAVMLHGSDIDGDTLTFEIIDAPGSGTLSAPVNSGADSARVNYTPDANFNGIDTFTFRVSDGQTASGLSTAEITVTPVNDPPVAQNAIMTVQEDRPGTVTVTATDIDNAGVTFSELTAPEHGQLTITANGAKTASVRYTPEADYFGPDSAVLLATDDSGGTDTATLTINVVEVNDVPVAIAKLVTTDEDTAVEIMLEALQPEAGELVFTADTTGTAGSLSSILQISSDVARLVYTPAKDFEGTDTFTFRATDATGASGTATVEVTVVPVPDPVVAADDTITIPEDAASVLELFTNDYNPDEGDRLALVSFDAPTRGIAEPVADRGLRYTPFPDFNGSETLKYTVRDRDGFTSTASVLVTVAPAKDNPVAIQDVFYVPSSRTTNLRVLANDRDPDGTALQVVSVEDTLAHDAVINGDGTIAYTPDPRVLSGEDSFTYVIENAARSRATGSIRVVITPSPTTQVSNDLFDSAVRNNTTLLPVLSNDSAKTLGDLWIVGVTQPPNGVVSLTTDATTGQPALLYQAVRRTSDNDIFSYTITDGTLTAVGEARVRVQRFNQTPRPLPDAYAAAAGVPLSFQPLLNDLEPDGDTLSIADVSSPLHGTLEIIDQTTLRYTPDADYSGVEELWYSASDGKGAGAIAMVTFQVAPAGPAFRYAIDYAACNEGGSVAVTPLRNDFNPSPVPVPLGAVTQPRHGTIEVRIDQTVLYTPEPGYTGSDSFTYRWSGDTSNAPAGQVSLTVLQLPASPALGVLTYAADEDEAIAIDPADGVEDPLTGDPVTLVAVGPGINGATALTGDPLINYTPALNYFGADQFLYTIETPAGLKVSGTAEVEVASVNDPPSFSGPTQLALFEDKGTQVIPNYYFNILPGPANESEQTTAFSFEVSGTPLLNGLPTVSPNGTLTVVTAPDAFGSATITVTLTDSGTPPLSAVSTIALSITPINDPPSFTAGPNVSVAKNSAPFTAPNWAFNASPGPRNESGQTLRYVVEVEDDSLFFAQPMVSPIGTLSFTPRAGAEGTTNIFVTLYDSGGRENGGRDYSPPITRTITVGNPPAKEGTR
ncbi:MAG: tandem-95 repeat protein [Candidatus Hydrogenedens sp.]|nr:tandem-95 repeat protein [Candidatus Hydrogenedens sp.]